VTFKDLLRLLQRRYLTALLSSLAVFGSFLAFTLLREQPQFKARARALLSTPPLLVTATQGTQWISVNQVDPKAWFTIIQGRKIRAATRERLRMKPAYAAPGAIREEWLATIAAVPESGEQLVSIEAIAPDPQVATDVANAAAEASEAESKRIANRDLDEARSNAQKSVDAEAAKIKELELGVEQIRENARTQHGSENLELDVRKLQEEILGHESRRRDLARRTSSNRLQLERVREDRASKEHGDREFVPRTPSLQLRVAEHPQVRALTDRLESLQRELLTLLRKYTNEHPTIKGLRTDLSQTAVDLTQAEALALGRDIDRDELRLRSEIQLFSIEDRVLEPELKELRDRLAILSPIEEDVRKRERAVADAKARLAPLDALKSQLVAAPAAMGYVQIQQAADRADVTPIEMKLRKSWPVALLAAVIAGLSFAFLVDFLDTSLRNDYDVRRHLDFPVLAVVPRVASEEVLTVQTARTSVVSEIYDTLSTVLLSAPSAQPSRIIMVTSTNPQEGKTAVSTNLAVALARQGKRALLVDADMRIPSVHSTLGLANATGLSDLLSGMVQLGTEGVLQDAGVPNLKAMTSGIVPENPYELLDPARIAPVGAMLRGHFDVIVVDTPPVLQAGDSLKLSTIADAVLFVIKAGATDVRQATWAKRLLTNVGAKVTGVVLNGAPRESGEYYHYPYYSHARSPRPF
jgi:capsular exopolysaccharide synthesis family protein